MAVNSRDFVEFAESLSSNASEIERRMIVGRAYYGAYHACEAWHRTQLPQQGHNVGMDGGLHQVLINQLKTPDISCSRDDVFKSKGLAYVLIELKDWRTQSDYLLDEQVTTERAENAKAKARVVLEKTGS